MATQVSSISTVDDQRGGGAGFLILLLLAGVVIYFSMQHAVGQHGAVAYDIVEKCNGGQWLFQAKNPLTGRQAKVCQITDGGFGIAVYEAGDELVTAFKNKAKTLEQAIKYLINSGYK